MKPINLNIINIEVLCLHYCTSSILSFSMEILGSGSADEVGAWRRRNVLR